MVKNSLLKVSCVIGLCCIVFCGQESGTTAPPPRTYGIDDAPGVWYQELPPMGTGSSDTLELTLMLKSGADAAFSFSAVFKTLHIPLVTDSGTWSRLANDTVVLNGTTCMVLDTATKQLVPFTTIYPQYQSVPPVKIPVALSDSNTWTIKIGDLKPLIYVLVPPTEPSSEFVYNIGLILVRKN